MSDKLVWSSNMTQDYFLSLDPESAKAELVDWGYEPEMLAGLDEEGLNDLIASDDYMWQNDADEFEQGMVPMISSQTKDGIVLMSGTAGTWRGDFKAGKAVYADELAGGDICRDCDEIRIDDVDGLLVWSGCHHDGCHHMGLYALPEDYDTFIDFMQLCMQDYINDELDYNEDVTGEEVVDYAFETLSIEDINDYCDFSKVPGVCEPIRNTAHVAEEALEEPVDEACIEEAELDEAKSKNVEALAAELEELKEDFEDFGPEGFYAVPFDNFAKEFPEFTNTCIMTYLKDMDLEEPEDLADPEYLNQAWADGELILPEDWATLLDGAERLTTFRKDKGIQWEKINAAHSGIEK